MNEDEAIVTSMNLYSFSQQNNDEMGIYVKKKDDPELYNDILNEVQRLLTISEKKEKPDEPITKIVDKKKWYRNF
jgi:phosphatidylserine/phosphatidylglycerophosphate/cardiolipin synthase-like enzyme